MKNRAAAILFGVILLTQAVEGQNTSGRWALGVGTEANLWLNDMSKPKPGFGADVVGRYGLSQHFSLGLEFRLQALKAAQSPLQIDKPYSYLKLNATPVALSGWWHLSPGSQLAPYVFLGAGLMRYTRIDGVKTYQPDPSDRISFYIPIGVGLEMFTAKGMSITLSGSYTLLNKHTDLVRSRKLDGVAAARIGLNIFIGSSDDDDEDGDGLTNADERRVGTNPTNPDTDEDGLSDGAEVLRLRTDPLNPDSDGDMIKDGDEVYIHFTDPLNPDTDGDGFGDFAEVRAGTDPLDPESHPPK